MQVDPNDLNELYYESNTHLLIQDGVGLAITNGFDPKHNIGLLVHVLNTEAHFDFKTMYLMTPDKAREIGRSLIDHARLADTREPGF